MWKAMDKNTLGMAGDMDAVCFIEEIEDAFAVRMTDAEAAGLANMGDLFDLLARRLNAVTGPRTLCFSQRAYYRIRAALRDGHADRAVTLDSNVGDYVDDRDTRRWRDALGNVARLNLPVSVRMSPRATRAQSLIIAAVFAASLTLAFLLVTPWPLVAAFAVAGLVAAIADALASRVLAENHTMRELARETAVRNFGRLSREHGSCHPGDLWQALAAVARHAAGTDYKGPIDRTTRFY